MPIKNELFLFIKSNLSEADAMISNIDSDLLEYLENVIYEYDNEEFEFELICEMLEAYVPVISKIKRDIQVDWLISMIESHRVNPTYKDASSGECEVSPQLVEGGAGASLFADENESDTSKSSTNIGIDNLPEDDHLSIAPLLEMFPADDPDRLRLCFKKSNGCIDTAIDLVLSGKYKDVTLKQELPDELSSSDVMAIKGSILDRYSLYEAGDEEKKHRPVLPKYEKSDKKHVRYLNNQVVDTKGSKYLEIKSENTGPKPIHLKPLKKYRFH